MIFTTTPIGFKRRETSRQETSSYDLPSWGRALNKKFKDYLLRESW